MALVKEKEHQTALLEGRQLKHRIVVREFSDAKPDWRRGSESNRRIKVLQTSPLPLGYRAPFLAVISPSGETDGFRSAIIP